MFYQEDLEELLVILKWLKKMPGGIDIQPFKYVDISGDHVATFRRDGLGDWGFVPGEDRKSV